MEKKILLKMPLVLNKVMASEYLFLVEFQINCLQTSGLFLSNLIISWIEFTKIVTKSFNQEEFSNFAIVHLETLAMWYWLSVKTSYIEEEYGLVWKTIIFSNLGNSIPEHSSFLSNFSNFNSSLSLLLLFLNKLPGTLIVFL